MTPDGKGSLSAQSEIEQEQFSPAILDASVRGKVLAICMHDFIRRHTCLQSASERVAVRLLANGRVYSQDNLKRELQHSPAAPIELVKPNDLFQ